MKRILCSFLIAVFQNSRCELLCETATLNSFSGFNVCPFTESNNWSKKNIISAVSRPLFFGIFNGPLIVSRHPERRISINLWQLSIITNAYPFVCQTCVKYIPSNLVWWYMNPLIVILKTCMAFLTFFFFTLLFIICSVVIFGINRYTLWVKSMWYACSMISHDANFRSFPSAQSNSRSSFNRLLRIPLMRCGGSYNGIMSRSFIVILPSRNIHGMCTINCHT